MCLYVLGTTLNNGFSLTQCDGKDVGSGLDLKFDGTKPEETHTLNTNLWSH